MRSRDEAADEDPSLPHQRPRSLRGQWSELELDWEAIMLTPMILMTSTGSPVHTPLATNETVFNPLAKNFVTPRKLFGHEKCCKAGPDPEEATSPPSSSSHKNHRNVHISANQAAEPSHHRSEPSFQLDKADRASLGALENSPEEIICKELIEKMQLKTQAPSEARKRRATHQQVTWTF